MSLFPFLLLLLFIQVNTGIVQELTNHSISLQSLDYRQIKQENWISNSTYGYMNEEFFQYSKRPLTLFIERSSFFPYLQDEKQMMLSTFKNVYIKPESCSNYHKLISFFYKYKPQLFKKCTDRRRFSHCQQYYLFQYDTTTKQCHSYYHEKYLYKNYTGVTMTLNLSPNRMDRLPLHFSRWKGPMSIALQLTEEEFKATMKSVELINRENIRFTFYVVKASHSQQPRCTYINQKGKTIGFETCFVINELRNLAIETIQTTHFMILDGDGILSKTFEQDFIHFIPLLSNEKEVLLFPIFPSHSRYNQQCVHQGRCKEAWKALPQTKYELLKDPDFARGYITSQKIVDFEKWKTIMTNSRMDLSPSSAMEPYGVFKRTRNLPLFHPYFINYQGNKEHYYNVLNTMNYHYNVMTLDFAVDLPHPASKYKRMARSGANLRYTNQMFVYFYNTFKEYCKQAPCNYFNGNRNFRRWVL